MTATVTVKFCNLLQCSAVDIQTESFTIQTVPASLPAVGYYQVKVTDVRFSEIRVK